MKTLTLAIAALLAAAPVLALDGKWTPNQVLEIDPAWLKQQGLELEPAELWDARRGTGLLAGPDPREMAKSDCVVIWGTNAVVTQVNVMTHVGIARKTRGAKLAVIEHRIASGKKIIPGMEDAKTQDFLMIRSPVTPFANADDFVALLRAADNPLLLLPRMIGHFGFGRGLGLLKQLSAGLAQPMTPLASTRYFSALPIKYGPYAVHYALTPHDRSSEPVKKGGGPEQLGEELAATLRVRPVSYDFQVQFFVDATRTPIEDASVEWKESDAPFFTVGRLEIKKQDVSSARGQKIASLVDGFSFDPWHALEEHRPLGNQAQLRVGNQRGDFDDGVGFRQQAGELCHTGQAERGYGCGGNP